MSTPSTRDRANQAEEILKGLHEDNSPDAAAAAEALVFLFAEGCEQDRQDTIRLLQARCLLIRSRLATEAAQEDAGQ
jgi:hypothetical protein